VLCEKPLALNRLEVMRMYEAARQHGVMLLESYPYWFQPQTRELLNCLSRDQIGRVQSMQACFGFTLGNPERNIRMQADLGGGALLDAGSYPISLIRLVMGCAPECVMAHAQWAATGVDISMMATLLYADGRSAQMSCAMNAANHRRATIVGTHGTVETEYLNHTSDSHTHPWGSTCPVNCACAKASPTALHLKKLTHRLAAVFVLPLKPSPMWCKPKTCRPLNGPP
jgi:predicted dehydrogenase